LPHVSLKCEFEGPTHTQKDRVAGALVRAAIDLGLSGITVGSCGNFGAAIAYASGQQRLPCTVFVPRTYSHTRAEEIEQLGASVVAWGTCYEDAVAASQDFARSNGAFDANPIGEAGEIAVRAYGDIVDELAVQSPLRIGSIWIPVGNGTCAAGVYHRLRELGMDTAVCSVGRRGNTAVTASLLAGRVIEIDRNSLRETWVNEPLVNWRSLHVVEGMEAVQRTRGHFCEAEDEQLLAAHAEVEQGPRASPAGAAGLVGLKHFADSLNHDHAHVVVLTS